MLHEKSEDILKSLYKSASFVVQAICYQKTGTYISRQKTLIEVASPDERAIIQTFVYLKAGGTVSFQEQSEALFAWAKKWIEVT